MKPLSSLPGHIKSFVAHVAGVAAGVVIGAAAIVGFAALAPHIFAWTVGGLAVAGGAYGGAKAADVLYHWAHGDDSAHRLTSHLRQRSGSELG